MTGNLWNVESLYGKQGADKGGIGRNLFLRLFVDGVQLVTKLRSNMKGAGFNKRVGQATAQETGHYRNGKQRAEEHRTGGAFKTQTL